jgi:hypothetical protein
MASTPQLGYQRSVDQVAGEEVDVEGLSYHRGVDLHVQASTGKTYIVNHNPDVQFIKMIQ